MVADLAHLSEIKPANFFGFGYNYSVPLDKWNIADQAADYVFVGDNNIDFEVPGTLRVITNYQTWKQTGKGYPLMDFPTYLEGEKLHSTLNFVEINAQNISEQMLQDIKNNTNAVLVLTTENIHGMPEQRRFFFALKQLGIELPVIIKRSYYNTSDEEFRLYSATDIGALLLDGFGDGLWLKGEGIAQKFILSTAFGILQATRTRISKTEYISCPSCGRTLFDLQETTAKIRKVTNHLKGVKIGIMGCIVNGPGEMADADYGYVGSGPGKITLYKEKEVVRRSIPTEQAVDALIDLIKEYGDWVEPKDVA